MKLIHVCGNLRLPEPQNDESSTAGVNKATSLGAGHRGQHDPGRVCGYSGRAQVPPKALRHPGEIPSHPHGADSTGEPAQPTHGSRGILGPKKDFLTTFDLRQLCLRFRKPDVL
ncbi:hypothetical protein AVEN_14622-1 [Araneus ventricosus]|uniref:Uncharacterized protein n=1 Tax=Araneus ventricosus TaxID=182803 RepID=A0A4Y2U2B8_ARAVE|nr:hypothetical protein AVEN_258029-1 [Araneus ventricosus]GBO06201.1 hypothetical protein AVEN_14622-1 [Araneus ventricosus]